MCAIVFSMLAVFKYINIDFRVVFGNCLKLQLFRAKKEIYSLFFSLVSFGFYFYGGGGAFFKWLRMLKVICSRKYLKRLKMFESKVNCEFVYGIA